MSGKAQGGSTLGSSGGGGSWKEKSKAGSTFESVSEAPPTSQSLLGPLPAVSSSSSSAPYGSVKKGKASTPSQTEGTQKEDSSKRKKVTGERASPPTAESAPQQV